MLKKILIANRGEIALRIMNTCKEMGIASVAIYSDADKNAEHKIFADESVYIGRSEPSESYLNIEKIIAAAKQSSAQAIHPGYGFLSENADFARKCQDEGIVFIGPGANVIRDLGKKPLARQIMIKSGIPVIPGMNCVEKNLEKIACHAEKIGYPVMIKLAAGGGGKGMRIVESEKDLKKECEAAKREAFGAFGNEDIYLEKYLSDMRHIEIQILADNYGNVIHLFERECSIQRRHQKIIEETPSPVMTRELREKMGEAAVLAAKAAGYVNAGTVEFLVDNSGNYYFLEVNTRLQVEHPVTEAITGIDIVREQIGIASGNRLQISQKDVAARGHAVECRIYAEDPENDFSPSPGKILFVKTPDGPGVRNDCGIVSGSNVPVEYDPILSKLIVYGQNREVATKRMVSALSEYVISGVKTSIPFLLNVFKSEPFKSGDTHTDFIEQHFKDTKVEGRDADIACIAFIADEFISNQRKKLSVSGKSEIYSPWESLGNWRINPES